MPMPGVFSAINTRLQTPLVGKDLQALNDKLPAGKVVKQEGIVQSIVVPGTDIYLKGKYDLLVERPDGTYILVDLKISKPNIEHILKYKTQLGSYKFALENAAEEKSIKVTKLGLLIFYPDEVDFSKNKVKVTFPPKWFEVPIDDEGFIQFAHEVNMLLTGAMPKETKGCKWCKYRHLGEELSHPETGKDLPF